MSQQRKKASQPKLYCQIINEETGGECGQWAQHACLYCHKVACFEHLFHSAYLRDLEIYYCWPCALEVLEIVAQEIEGSAGDAKD